MIDAHIHIERGPYTLEWINEFVKTAINKDIDEIWLLEHCYRFTEFVSMYDSVCAYSDYIDKWFHRKASVFRLTISRLFRYYHTMKNLQKRFRKIICMPNKVVVYTGEQMQKLA